MIVYDVHHHRCHLDSMRQAEATMAAHTTWTREPLVHISSPLRGWQHPQAHRHHDYIAIHDFLPCWTALDITVEVEAKVKELAAAKPPAAAAQGQHTTLSHEAMISGSPPRQAEPV